MPVFGSQELSETICRVARSAEKQGHIAFVLTHGFMARMVLRSGIARQLIAQGFRVTAISPNADESVLSRGVSTGTRYPVSGASKYGSYCRLVSDLSTLLAR